MHGCFGGLPASDVPFIPARIRMRVLAVRPHVPVRRVDHIGGRLHSFASHIGGNRAAFTALTHVCDRSPNSTQVNNRVSCVKHNVLSPTFTGMTFGLASPGGVSGVIRSRFNCRVVRLVSGQNSGVGYHRVLLGPGISRRTVSGSVNHLSSVNGSVHTGGFAFRTTMRTLSSSGSAHGGGKLVTGATRTSGHASGFRVGSLPARITHIMSAVGMNRVSTPFAVIGAGNGAAYTLVGLIDEMRNRETAVARSFRMVGSIILTGRERGALRS